MFKKKVTIGGVRLPLPAVVVVGLLLLLIPTAVMIGVWAGIDNTALFTESIDTVILKEGETVIVKSPTDDEGSILSLLTEINKTAKETALPDNLANYTVFTAQYRVYGQDADYTYYLSEDPSQCFFTSNFGKSYRIGSDAAKTFLCRKDAETVYAGSVAPTLDISGKRIEPQSLTWNYRACNGEFFPASCSFDGPYKDNELSDISMNLKCGFSRQPDSLTSVVTNEAGEEIYNGDVAGMAAVTLEKSVKVMMTITAVWEQGGAACGGTAVYKVKGVLHAPAEFYLNTATVTEGGFVVLTGANVLNMNELSVKVRSAGNGATEYTDQPVFYRDGDYVRALIPVSRDMGNGNCGYEVLVTLGENTYQMEFTATKNENINPATRNAYNAVRVPSGYSLTANPYHDLYNRLAAEIAKTTDFTTANMAGEFVESCTGAGKNGTRSAYGTVLTYTEIQNGGTIVAADNCWVGSLTLKAMHSGKVAFVGNDGYTGTLVVIDHGFGLLSWYWNLNPESIPAGIVPGAEIEAGAVIGRNGGGDTGFSEVYNGYGISAHTALTVHGVPVDSSLVKKGVSFADGESTRVIGKPYSVIEDLTGSSDDAE